jgi:hypothetical protein
MSAPDDDRRRTRRVRFRDFLVGTLVRPLMLAGWLFVFWGTLVTVVFLVKAARSGLPEAVSTIWPGPEASVWGWVNLGSIPFALVVWAGVALFLLTGRGDDSR